MFFMGVVALFVFSYICQLFVFLVVLGLFVWNSATNDVTDKRLRRIKHFSFFFIYLKKVIRVISNGFCNETFFFFCLFCIFLYLFIICLVLKRPEHNIELCEKNVSKVLFLVM